MPGHRKSASSQVLQQLRQSLDHSEAAERTALPAWKSAPLRTSSPLDRLLPADGLRRGAVVEWLGEGSGRGATTLALCLARVAVRGGGALVVIDRQQRFYPPAAAALAIEPSQLVLVRPRQDDDEIWALDQAARCTGVGAVLWRGQKLDARHFRRLQLDCEASGVTGLLVRPHTARGEPSWAELRLLVRKCESHSAFSARRLRVEVLRCRGQTAASAIELEIDHETGQIREAVSLRMAARRAVRRRRRA